ncbi:retropepsin-like aspartic protease [Asaia bogorensis]|uniref:retropepsin-like aspartic protease n=1 Tax=Asaia bogorensis TaxID=91915 RepID=UPI000EFCA581|nr:retropepsin-like aspartic protease [Asaia bogorensis]
MRLLIRSLILGSLTLLLGNPQAQATPRVQGFAVSPFGIPPVTDPVIDPIDKDGIVASIRAGNQPALLAIRDRMAQKAPLSSVDQYLITLADAGLARINGDYTASNAALDRGLRLVGHHADTTQELNALLLLGESLRYGNLFLSSDLSGWIERTTWLEHVYFAPIRAFYELPNLKFPNLTLLTPLVPASSVTNPSVIASDEEQMPLLVTSNDNDGRHVIDVQVQATLFGQNDWALLDTGSLAGVIPRSYVTRYHLPVIVRSTRGSDGFRRNMSINYVIVPEVRLGKTVLKNQIFTVAPIPFPVLGLLQLGQLRHLTIDSAMLRFGPHAPFDCHEPLRMASVMAGVESRLIFPYERDGQKETAGLDTGDNATSILSIRTPTLPAHLAGRAQTKLLTTVAGKVTYRTTTAPATVAFPDFTVQDRIKYIQSSMPDTLIPSGILKHARLSLDMTEHVACLTPYKTGHKPSVQRAN